MEPGWPRLGQQNLASNVASNVAILRRRGLQSKTTYCHRVCGVRARWVWLSALLPVVFCSATCRDICIRASQQAATLRSIWHMQQTPSSLLLQ